jgi:phospholipid-binding lipoprotein MlaA
MLVAGFLLFGTEGCASKTSQPDDTPIGSPVTVSNESSSPPEKLNSQLNDDSDSEDLTYDPFEETDSDEFEEYDPWEPFNLWMFSFNYNFDKYFLKYVAKGYNYVVPDDLQQGIYNAFQNLGYTPRLLNNVFQGKWKGAGIETGRFLINTTLGVGGLFDPATIMFDLETPIEDFGQTMGSYGTNPGPYLVVPFLGPFTLRDAFGYAVDIFLNPINWFVFPIIKTDVIPQLVTNDLEIAMAQFGLRSWNIVNLRSINLGRFEGIEEGTLDLYGAVRNGYLQNRANAINE